MNLPLLTKLLVSFCTVGGGSVGAFFASNPFIGGIKGGEKEQVVKSQEKEKESPTEVSPKTTTEEAQGVKTQEEDSKSKEDLEQSQSDQELINSDQQTDLKVSENDSKETQSQEIQFEDQTIRRELENSSGFSDENTEEIEEVKEEVKESFDTFEEYEEEDDLEDEEGLSSSAKVGEYIGKVREDGSGNVLEVTCDNWIKEYDGNIGRREVKDKQECEGRKKRSSWGKGGLTQPTAWLEIDKSKAKKVLVHYGLWIDKVSSFTGKEKDKWNTRDRENRGNWTCSRETFGHNEKKFLISCDLYQ
ncbi:hypothetical protein [Mycoplasma suis]|uniref:Uncharacterized protein n=1 Tax=Mycoplasma suis (strain Illinois) TaxID=768700 RepID=F0QQL3_MYCSL|nr:hypothetical protein [Mycoplasma suis]ADX97783.1 hypothetical protein MSU_0239 [Mycoplasma suis str. Illinois]